jgi:hypothetical protein
MKPIVRSYLIEANVGNTVPGNNTNLVFTDYPQLRKIYICGVAAFDVNQVLVSPQGRTVVPSLTGAVLTLMDENQKELIYRYPMYDLDPFNVGGFYRDIRPFPLQLTKSYITILDNTGLSANESYLLNIFYIEERDAMKFLKNQ